MYDENQIENANETIFVFSMGNEKSLGFKGDSGVNYADVTSEGDAVTLIVRLSGDVNARIETPMLIFKSQNRSYHIRVLQNNVRGFCYRSGPKGWMD